MNVSNVVVLGASGSGKTVYLSSMYHKLSVPAASGYFLDAPLEHQKHLTVAFATLLRHGWLDATGWSTISAYDFTVTVKTPEGNNHQAITLRYHDMAGGRQTALFNDATVEAEISRETDAVIKKADVLLALIDGRKVRDYLKSETIDAEFWFSHMQSLCNELTKHNAKDKSLHFILTKWDLFDNKDTSLRKAAAALLSDETFRKLVESCAGRARLIPVSSVGTECAKCLDETRKTRPTGDTTPIVLKRSELPRPINIEVPFACILPDILEMRAKEIIAEAEAKATAITRPVDPQISWWEKILGRVGDFVAMVADKYDHKYIAETLRQAADFARRRERTKQENAAAAEAENRAIAQNLRVQVKDETSAIRYALEVMMQTESAFLDKFPSSDLKAVLGLDASRRWHDE